MKNELLYSKEHTIYPVEYIPNLGIESLLEEIKICRKKHALKPLVNIDEFKDCFKAEILMPGVKRENIFIHIEKPVLTITVLYENFKQEGKPTTSTHEFETDSFEHQILLPGNSDIEFINASYIEGILHIYIPKTKKPEGIRSCQVVVY